MNKFTHGIMVVDPTNTNDNGDPLIVHFVGYWDEPTELTFTHLQEEFITDESHGLKEMEESGILEYYHAPQEIIDFYWNDVFLHEDENKN